MRVHFIKCRKKGQTNSSLFVIQALGYLEQKSMSVDSFPGTRLLNELGMSLSICHVPPSDICRNLAARVGVCHIKTSQITDIHTA